MKILSTIFGGSGLNLIRNKSRPQEVELPQGELYKLLWTYYLSNGLYDDLRRAGYYLENRQLKEIYNPASRVVEFYADVIWPGQLPTALPLQVEGDNPDAVESAIQQIWRWSNWQARKQVAVRWSAITGNLFLRVARAAPRGLGRVRQEDLPEAPKRVYIQLIKPEHVTEHEVDERDYITYARLDIPQRKGRGDKAQQYWYTEEWTPETLRIWSHTKSPETPLEDLGKPDYEVATIEWGIDFVPLVHAKHIDLGDLYGVGAFTLQLSKINELNRVATRLHQILFRHNDVTWALQSNMLDGSGRPIPAPRLDNAGSSKPRNDDLETVELGGEKYLRLPGMASLAPLVPQLNYQGHLATVQAMLQELERDLPELNYYRLKDLPEMSGKALRLVLTPALAKAAEARGNLEGALVRAQMMALTIGSKIGAFEGRKLGSYESGALEHHFIERPILPYSRLEIAELATTETGAGIPLITSLRDSGWTEERLEQMEDDREAEQGAQQATLASALLQAQAGMNSPEASNGLEQPTPPGQASGPAPDTEE